MHYINPPSFTANPKLLLTSSDTSFGVMSDVSITVALNAVTAIDFMTSSIRNTLSGSLNSFKSLLVTVSGSSAMRLSSRSSLCFVLAVRKTLHVKLG